MIVNDLITIVVDGPGFRTYCADCSVYKLRSDCSVWFLSLLRRQTITPECCDYWTRAKPTTSELVHQRSVDAENAHSSGYKALPICDPRLPPCLRANFSDGRCLVELQATNQSIEDWLSMLHVACM